MGCAAGRASAEHDELATAEGWKPKRRLDDGEPRWQAVVVEFDDLRTVLGIYDSPAGQAPVRMLDGGAVRDMRIVVGI